MDPLTASLAAQGIVALLEIFRVHTGKPKDWVPDADDWNSLEAWADRTPADIKREAREALGRKPEPD